MEDRIAKLLVHVKSVRLPYGLEPDEGVFVRLRYGDTQCDSSVWTGKMKDKTVKWSWADAGFLLAYKEEDTNFCISIVKTILSPPNDSNGTTMQTLYASGNYGGIQSTPEGTPSSVDTQPNLCQWANGPAEKVHGIALGGASVMLDRKMKLSRVELTLEANTPACSPLLNGNQHKAIKITLATQLMTVQQMYDELSVADRNKGIARVLSPSGLGQRDSDNAEKARNSLTNEIMLSVTTLKDAVAEQQENLDAMDQKLSSLTESVHDNQVASEKFDQTIVADITTLANAADVAAKDCSTRSKVSAEARSKLSDLISKQAVLVQRLQDTVTSEARHREAATAAMHEEIRALSRQLDDADKRTVSVASRIDYMENEIGKASMTGSKGTSRESGFDGLRALSFALPYVVKGAYLPLFLVCESLMSLSVLRGILLVFGIVADRRSDKAQGTDANTAQSDFLASLSLDPGAAMARSPPSAPSIAPVPKQAAGETPTTPDESLYVRSDDPRRLSLVSDGSDTEPELQQPVFNPCLLDSLDMQPGLRGPR
eukprot:gene14580-22303_t